MFQSYSLDKVLSQLHRKDSTLLDHSDVVKQIVYQIKHRILLSDLQRKYISTWEKDPKLPDFHLFTRYKYFYAFQPPTPLDLEIVNVHYYYFVKCCKEYSILSLTFQELLNILSAVMILSQQFNIQPCLLEHLDVNIYSFLHRQNYYVKKGKILPIT